MSDFRVENLNRELEAFIREIPIADIIGRLSSDCQMNRQDAQEFLATYINEMHVTLRLVRDRISPNLKMLEIGAGLCLFSLFLKNLGCEITALEPSSGGFDKFESAKATILDFYGDLNLKVLDHRAEDLVHSYDRFDLIFSNNVLEHIPDLSGAWVGMCMVLKQDGLMLHNCPNYIFPYEPHLGVPVFKAFPRLTSILFSNLTNKYKDIWESLNFITYLDVKRLARCSDMTVTFQKGLLFDAICRIECDPCFRKRHSGSIVTTIYAVLEKTRLLGALRYVPAMFATPMIFQCYRTKP